MLKVRFIEKAVGREAGTIEEVHDDTLALAWEEAGFVKILKAPKSKADDDKGKGDEGKGDDKKGEGKE